MLMNTGTQHAGVTIRCHKRPRSGTVGRFGLKFTFSVLVFVASGCDAPSDDNLMGISGVARVDDRLLLVDDETSGAYFTVDVSEGSTKFRLLDPLEREAFAVKDGIVDAEAIDVLADGRIVVLSERMRALLDEDGVVAEYPAAFSEFGNRGLEGLSVLPLAKGRSRVAVLWEGGYPAVGRLIGGLAEVASNRSFEPIVVVHEIDPHERGLVPALEEELDVTVLEVPIPPSDERPEQRFRAPDLVWDIYTGGDIPGFIVLLSSENSSGLPEYGHHWLQRFNRSGQPLGPPLDLDAVMPEDLAVLNWEGLDWFDEPYRLVLVCEDSEEGPGSAVLIDLRHHWTRDP